MEPNENTIIPEEEKVSITEMNQRMRERKEAYERALAFRKEKTGEDGQLSTEDHNAFEAMLADVNKMSERIDEMRAQLQVQDALAERTLAEEENKPDPDKQAYSRAFGDFLRRGIVEMDVENRALMTKHVQEVRALGIASGGVGAYTVPEDFYGKVVDTLLAYGGMRKAGCEILSTSGGNDLPVPVGDDTGNTGEIVTETSQVNTADPTFAQVVLKAYSYSSKIIRVHLSLLQDEAVGLEALLARWMATRIARITNTHFTTGDDTNKPDGVLNSCGDSGVQFASATAITWEELVDIMHSVDPAYQQNGVWMFADSTLANLKKIKNSSTTQPLWLPAVAAREPDTILGKRYVVNQDFPAFTDAASKIIAFGDFSQYFIRDVKGALLMRLTERYADYLQVGFMLFTRHDGSVITTSAIKYALSHA